MFKLLVEVCGVALVVAGCTLVAVPLGLVVAGGTIVLAVEVRG